MKKRKHKITSASAKKNFFDKIQHPFMKKRVFDKVKMEENFLYLVRVSTKKTSTSILNGERLKNPPLRSGGTRQKCHLHSLLPEHQVKKKKLKASKLEKKK